jgi:GH25 family lysozyme M1 (1,4-beta-N-acetylmuramidase)
MGVQSAQGFDVSNYQGKFDWAATTGMSFGVYRMTQGLGANVNSPDPDASWNNAQITAKGLVRGAYHFFDPNLSGQAQAEYFVKQHSLIGLNDSDMLWLDHETAGASPAATSAAALAFMTELDKLRPNNPRGVYTFISFATGGHCAGLGKWPLWIAYPSAAAPAPPAPWSAWKFWQYGLRNGVDADAFNGTAAQLKAWVASYSPATAKPAPPKLAPPAPAAPQPGPNQPAPQVYNAPGNTSITTLAKQVGQTVPELIWLTAHNRPQGFGQGETAYIAAGNWDALMPAGMTVWA